MIIDASALLALLQGEPGSKQVANALEQGSISAANLSEVATKLIQADVPDKEVVSTLRSLNLHIVSVDEDTALLAGRLAKVTRQFGLSLGDRICLATAILHKEPAITADSEWSKVQYDGLDVRVIR
ncbi:MAG: type II toxin-antitoxin system VapC family toxin [Aestuariivita sp.]|nr:type II toxin-antitoxin system VapC family toxin [Aestuariivita sp.]MCY4202735.1 type II toxin-antitoxin system VapC family toxin [Aestuariivita sp.]MCY4289071.1 type II toxin-antitoxin system VapC family toxin [Aestuariivita sp.]MCY4347899.1 type II toxin-antitoxin system VapC family toxin [Aestuariivita sp.]